MSDTIAIDRQLHQTELLQRWLQHAPAPPERKENSYDVFISYRSTDRRWAMALYDALKLAGWEAFLDQYGLVPGTDLETSISEALEASSSGVILWSSRTTDSEWCKRERHAMRSLKATSDSFNYLYAKLDAEPLPLFARSDLYIGFDDSPEGPRGMSLLKLMCGLRGIALPPQAVEMAQQIDEATKHALIAIKSAVEAENAPQLLELGISLEPGILASPAPMLAAAQGLISLGKYDDARKVLRQARAHFPKSFRAKQLEGLALRRLKNYQGAIDVLSELKAEGHQDPETLGILGAAWNGRYEESGKRLHLRRSRDLYRSAFQSDPSDYYTGVNTASKSLFLGESDEAVRIADKVLPLVEGATDGEDFWAGCTLGEVYLIKKNLDSAASQYQVLIDKHATKIGDLEGTRQQAMKICVSHKLSDKETKTVLAPFELLDD